MNTKLLSHPFNLHSYWRPQSFHFNKEKSKTSTLKRHLRKNKDCLKQISNFRKRSSITKFGSNVDADRNVRFIAREEDLKGLFFDNEFTIISMLEMNSLNSISEFIHSINSKLVIGGTFIGSIRIDENVFNWNDSLFSKLSFPSRYLINKFENIFNLLVNRGKSKLILKKSESRKISRAEILGRLVFAGFEIEKTQFINNQLYFEVRKLKCSKFSLDSSPRMLLKMKRIGKNGEIVNVYKIRSMYPYSEFLHDYILKTNGYGKFGKPSDDFRITPLGKFIRRYWIDEIPQIINLFKGDLKLIGVRPVSLRYFNDIPKEMQKLRITQKPGCIPPYISLNKKADVLSILQAEKEYLESKLRNPYITDLKYFVFALINILIKGKRSA